MGTISNQIRQIVIDLGISRYRLSKESGIDEGALSRFMAGTANLSLDAVDRIGVVLHLELISHRPQAPPLTLKDVAKRLRISRVKARRLLEKGIIRAQQEGDDWSIHPRDLAEYYQKRKRQGG